MIKLINLRRSFQKRIVFDYFSYDFNDTGLYILTGDNGCGKTTLLYFLALIDDGFKGKYLFDKEDLNILTPKKKEEFRDIMQPIIDATKPAEPLTFSLADAFRAARK